MRRSRLTAAALLACVALPALAQTVSGHAFEDRNGNGVQDPGEPPLPGVAFRLAGKKDAGPVTDTTIPTDAAGAYLFSPGSGCYVLQPLDPPEWRLGPARSDGFPPSTPGYTAPVGQPRFAKLDQGIARLQSGTFRITAMGDSIARNFNFCSSSGAFWYTQQVQSRLLCAFPAATSTLDQAAQLGETTDDLLVDETNNMNNVFRAIEAQPQLITISAIGNDLLDVDPPANPTQAQINRAVAEVLDARQNLQEILSVLSSQVPGADIVLNSLYDNLAYNCSTGNSSDFHRAWLPIVDRILRDLAWGQSRRVSIAEAAAEFAHEDQQGGCSGFEGKICRDIFHLDNIHPNNAGYSIVREKLWESVGGVNLGPKDALGRTSIAGADYGYLRRVRRLFPTVWQTLGGATAIDAAAATSDQDGGAAAQITLGAGGEEFRLSGFPDWYDEIQIVRVLAGVRYRTTGAVGDDFYRMEASVTGQFRPPPGFSYSPMNWNFFTPIVGGGGPNQPPENSDFPAEKLLALPNVALFREVSALLTKNPTLPPGAAEYQWPALTHDELPGTTIRVASAPVAGTSGNDGYQVELDAAWLDLYGWEKTRPPEVSGAGGNGGGGAEALKVERLADGSLLVSFAAVAGAQRYNLYMGRLSTLPAGAYDHGAGAPAGPLCDAPVQSAGPGRLSILIPPSGQPGADLYLLVTAHVDDVESPSGFRSDGTEIDRSQSICR
ncbi:MAG TPA: GDSL-type esterase/lipase family protein [Candidatus Polarisedimenticolia bacterium]|nr:GDSL-type esterase/lipase family protein [Candidatus Polarisedimenticolia bacterium]